MAAQKCGRLRLPDAVPRSVCDFRHRAGRRGDVLLADELQHDSSAQVRGLKQLRTADSGRRRVPDFAQEHAAAGGRHRAAGVLRLLPHGVDYHAGEEGARLLLDGVLRAVAHLRRGNVHHLADSLLRRPLRLHQQPAPALRHHHGADSVDEGCGLRPAGHHDYHHLDEHGQRLPVLPRGLPEH